MRVRHIFLVCICGIVAGCATRADTTQVRDGGADASMGVNTPIDAGMNSVADSGANSSPDGGSTTPVDAGMIAPMDAGNTPDAGPGINFDGGTTIVIMQPISGTVVPTTVPLHGPGTVLMGGGTDVDAAFIWMHDTVAGSPTTKMGNLIVLRADSNTDNTYTPYIYALAPFQSVVTIYLGGASWNETSATPTDLEIAAYYVNQADIVFFAGGDQADYVSWKGTPLMDAVAALPARGGVIGGTSAGCAIQGPFVFDSAAADLAGGADVETADAVANPFESTISFTLDMLTPATLPKVITDMHFVTRDRFGRLAAFVARQYADGAATSGVIGVGVDESNALLIDKMGNATLVQQDGGTEAKTGSGAYILQPSGPATQCDGGQPLLYEDITVTRLANPATDSFNFSKGCGTGVSFDVTVDGTKPANPYSISPFKTAGTATACP